MNKLLKKPLYLQLADSIEQAFENKVLESGELLPTEKEICQAFNVSTSVVKYAYGHLMDKGIIKREMGRGTFINTDMSQVIDLKEGFDLFLDNTRFKRTVNYIEESTNKTDLLKPAGPLRSVHEVVSLRKKPVGVRKLFIQQSVRNYFLEEGWDTSQRMRFVMTHFQTVRSHMRVINLKAKDAKMVGLKQNAAAFYQKVDFYQDKELVGVLENFYPGDFFVWRQDFEAVQLH